MSLRSRIAAAAARSGRDPSTIRLLAVSKGQPAEAIRAMHSLGVADFAESYVQEALEKMEALGEMPGIHWHFIGRLQSNKTRAVAQHFAWVHSVDREQIARRLNEQRPADAPRLNVCLQVRLGDEPTKGGAEPDGLPVLAAAVASLQRLKLRGLMCLPPPTSDVAQQRAWFRQLRELFLKLNDAGHGMDTLSMGMSDDFEAAIEEGATIVRIGTALFGPRNR